MSYRTRDPLVRAALAAVALLAATAASHAAVSYSISFSGAQLRDLQGNDTGETWSGSYSFTLPSYLAGAATITPDSCSLSANAMAFYFCRSTQDLDPNGFNTGKNFAGFSVENIDLSGGGTGFLWFDTGSFGADGVYPLFTGSITNATDSYGNFAPQGSLVVRTLDNPNGVPAPTPLMLLAFGGAALVLRRRHAV